MGLRKVLLVFFIVFAFILTACDGGLGTYSGEETYSNEMHGFEIVPPKGWVDGEIFEGNSIVSFVNSYGDIEEGGEPFYANIGVLFESSQGLTFSEYMEISKETTKGMIEGIEYLEEIETEVSGYPAEIVTSKFDQGDADVIVTQLMTMKDDRVYIITGASLASAWDENEKEIKSSLESFNFN